MVGCLYDVVEVSLLGGVGVLLCFVSVGWWVVEVLRVKNMSSVGWFCLVGSIGGLYGSVHGAGNAMLMRGGACAAELRLMGLWVASCFDVGVVCACCSFTGCCFLLRGLVLCCGDFIFDLRLYVLVGVGVACGSCVRGSLFVFIVVPGCSGLVVVVGVVDVGLFLVWDS
jgi:hypothetical protein